MQAESARWGVVLFAAREAPGVLIRSIEAARVAAVGRTTIDVMVNGNASLVTSVVALLQSPGVPQVNGCLRMWSIPHGDKANAWNQYLHHIWRGEEIAFFVDGYVQLQPDALGLLGKAVLDGPGVLGGSGVPTQGRSAKALRANMLVNGGFHGNLCCIQGDVIQRLKDRGIKLPVGLYRTDSLMGAFLAYNLDPGTDPWADERIAVHPDASWRVDAQPVWHVSALRSHWKRMLRQARGVLELAAFREHAAVRRLPPERLPDTASAMVSAWVRDCPQDARQALGWHPLRWWALRQLRRESAGLGAANVTPTLVWSNGCTHIGPSAL